MKIQSLKTFNVNKPSANKMQIQNPIQRHNLSFSGRNDEFIKVADNAFEVAIISLKIRLEKLIKESQVKKVYSNISEELEEIQSRNAKMADISEKFQIINEALTRSSYKELSKDAGIVADFIDAMYRIDKNEGFNRISGYDEIKKTLENKFVLKTMMMARTSQKVDVPNALMIYGPTNVGKTTFARALAEQTLSNIETVDAGKMTEDDAMKKIIEFAKQSKQNYISSGDKKQRTIILINEAEVLAAEDSLILKDFKNLINNCAEEYKCTLFLTTNKPNFFDASILDKAITPIKIGIEPADEKTAKKIVDNMLVSAGKLPKESIEKFVDAFYANPDRYYSNGDIVRVVNDTLSEFNNPSINDFISVLGRNEVPPSISKKSLNDFYNTKADLEN